MIYQNFLTCSKLKGSLADIDGRLKINDRILEINCKNVKYGNKEEALKLIGVSYYLNCVPHKFFNNRLNMSFLRIAIRLFLS
jgi:hypothetical protein